MEVWALVLFLRASSGAETFAGPAVIQGIASQAECERSRDTVRRTYRVVSFCVPYVQSTRYLLAK